MEEEILNNSLPCLKELENKVGRKTPESLLVWMRDAADCEDGWRSDAVDRGDRGSASGDSFSDKISSLKQEMVKIKIAHMSFHGCCVFKRDNNSFLFCFTVALRARISPFFGGSATTCTTSFSSQCSVCS